VFIIATMGLNLTVGYAGQKSLGHAAFFGIGAYTVAICLKAGISFWLALPAGGLLCFFTGLIVASLRCVYKPSTWHLPHWALTPQLGWSCAMKNG
jgi:ABC-type branched-subunit amino acid transport system permease subunit